MIELYNGDCLEVMDKLIEEVDGGFFIKNTGKIKEPRKRKVEWEVR